MSVCDPRKLLADAGYDSEHHHKQLRDYLEIDSLIPAKSGRPTHKLPTGKYRRMMTEDFDDETNGQRPRGWQVETVMFMLKNNPGDSAASRSEAAWSRELALKAVTHNILLAWS